VSVVVVAGGKGAPGATTTAIGLAAAWPAPRRLLVEADLDGGVLAARCRLAYEPGLVTLAAATRGPLSERDVAAHTQQLEAGASVLCAPTRPEQIGAALRACGPALASCLARLDDATAVVDIGRAWPSSPVAPLVEVADVVVMVCRPRVDEVQQLVARVDALRRVTSAVRVVLVGDAPYGRGDVDAVLGSEDGGVVVGVLPVDPRGADALNGQRGPSGWAERRAPLLRAVADLAGALATDVGEPNPSHGEIRMAGDREHGGSTPGRDVSKVRAR
jgi:MinD-like ATPase involved in chromosome partitioning or flagellar assembly